MNASYLVLLLLALSMLATGGSVYAPGLCPDKFVVEEVSAHAPPETYLRIPNIPPTEYPRSGAPRGLPRPEYGTSDAIESVAIPGLGECPIESYRAIISAATEYHVPLSIMFAVAYFESTYVADRVRYDPPREISVGLFQMNMLGGQGKGHNLESLKDPKYNANLAAAVMVARLVDTGSWWMAIEPWSVRDKVFR